MLKKSSILLFIVGTMVIAGCESKSGSGALIGGAGGAAIGSIVGGGEGALIGGAAGAITGGVIGAILDHQDQKNLQRESLHTYQRIERGDKLSVNDVINLSNANVEENKIINLIEKTNSHYTLNIYQIDQLRKAKVSEKVISFMIEKT